MATHAHDSISIGNRHITPPDSTHHIGLKSVIIPTSVFGISSLYVYVPWFKKQKKAVQKSISAQGKHKIKIDDYLQYSPIVATYAFNLCKVKGKHRIGEQTILLAMSYATMAVLVNSMKYTFKEKRPDSFARNSFPSGHTATAFTGAELLRMEYKDVSPWLAYSGYAFAISTAYLRIYNDRHYINDVVAGACIGYLSTKFAYWLYPKIFKRSDCNKNFVTLGVPQITNDYVGFSLCASF